MKLDVDVCNDIDIRGTILRQRSDDKSVIIEMDLCKLLEGTVDLPIANLKQKLDLFNIFTTGQMENQELFLEINENECVIYDQYTRVYLKNPKRKYLDNHFLEDDDMAVITMEPDNLILRCEIPFLISNRIKTITKNFNSLVIRVMYEGNTAYMTSTTQAKDQQARFLDNIQMELDISDALTNLAVLPFIIDHDAGIFFESYVKNTEHKQKLIEKNTSSPIILLNKTTTEIENVPVSIYFRSSIVWKE